MWLAPVAQLLVLATMLPQRGADSSVSAQATPQPVATRQALFALPFRIDRADHPSREPVEVQLWVSVDRGANWQLYSKVEPARRHFMFRTGAEGEYWFVTRTLDRSGQIRPQQARVPEMRVVVDTTLPKLHLQAHRGGAGQVIARWQIDETHPKPDSLTIQYRTTTDGPWQPVAIDRRNLHTSGSTQTGEVTWWPQVGSGHIQIRAEVCDTAGNLAVSHAQVGAGHAAGTQSAGSVEPASPQWRAGTADPSPTRWPADSSTNTLDPPTGSIASGVNPPIQNRYVPPYEQNGSWPGNGLPLGTRPQMVNQRMFELVYDIASVGPSGVSQVEVWGTRDGGRTWRSFTLDNDNRSPVLVTVDEEGIYGFRVVGTSGAGLGDRPPQSGDPPEVVIGVDLTKPAARIIATEQGAGLESGKLIISWQADDAILAARPVSLLFSESPGGPWTSIASGLENTGRYAWPIDNRLPQGIYLRLEVRDEAGNVGVFETSRSLVLDRLRPSVRIRDVRPLDQSTGTPPKRYYFP